MNRPARIAFLFSVTMILSTASPHGAEGGVTTVANITGGFSPRAGVTIDANGNLYGTTAGGGNTGATVYKLAKGESSVTTIASIVDGNAGGVTFDADGNLWGTTYTGGTTGSGTVYKIDNGLSTINTIASFGLTGGRNPWAGVTFDADGNLWGTTQVGGEGSGSGAVYMIAKGSNTITTIASFNPSDGSDIGSTPFAGVTFDSDGNLWGTTTFGGLHNGGTVYKIAKGSNTINTIASFNGDNGALPYAAVTFDANGNLYGTTWVGGSDNNGTVYKIAKGSNAITTIASFSDNGFIGVRPLGGVSLDAYGNLYGTTYQGGPNGAGGTLFKIAKDSNIITTLGAFNGIDVGYEPWAGVTFDTDGTLYGTTLGGGFGGQGTVFKYSTVAAVPEPSMCVLFMVGLGVCSLKKLRRKELNRPLD
jgi:uncharacterized repeat protein (TIGR03803 family)